MMSTARNLPPHPIAMKRILPALLILAVSAFSACKKETPAPPDAPPTVWRYLNFRAYVSDTTTYQFTTEAGDLLMYQTCPDTCGWSGDYRQGDTVKFNVYVPPGMSAYAFITADGDTIAEQSAEGTSIYFTRIVP